MVNMTKNMHEYFFRATRDGLTDEEVQERLEKVKSLFLIDRSLYVLVWS